MSKEINYYLKGFNDGMLRALDITAKTGSQNTRRTYNHKLTKKALSSIRSEAMKRAWIGRRLRQNEQNNNAENSIY